MKEQLLKIRNGQIMLIIFTIVALSGCSIPGVSSSSSKPKRDTNGLYTIKENGKCGYMNVDGEVKIKPTFEPIPLYDGAEADYRYCENFSEAMARIQNGGQIGFINTEGDIVINPKFKSARDFSEGLAVVSVESKEEKKDDADSYSTPKKTQKYGFVDKTGTYVVEPTYDLAFSFSEGLAAVKKDDKFGYIKKSGEMVIEPQFKSASEFRDGIAQVTLEGEKEGYINKEGTYVRNATK